MIAFVFTLITLLAFWSGYVSGGHGWWWVAFGCLIIYGGVYKFVDAGHGGGKH